MAHKITLDFDCPQYVDFAAELDASEKDVFFDCKDYPSPENENLYKSTPSNVKKLCPSEEEENRLMEKMTAALSVIENTPKLKMPLLKGKHLIEKFSTNLCQSVKPTLHPNTAPAVGLHRSKSIARLNKIVTENQNKLKGLGKRSSSLNDLRMPKKQTFPTTPMCLKRTIKAKSKVIKTTEEMELEEIAKLQKQLKEHLRYNEMSLKRLKLKAKPCIPYKNNHAKAENCRGNKGLNPPTEKLNVMAKEPRRTIHAMNHVVIKNEAMKIDNIIRGRSTVHKFADTGLNDDKNSKHFSVSSAAIGESSVKNKVQSVKKPLTAKKIGFHSGLVFHDNVKKNTIVQPFSFDAKIREKVMSVGAEQKSGVSFSNSSLKYKVGDSKENIPCDKLLSTLQKSKGMQNEKCDIVKQLASLKKTGKQVRNSVRGLALSENIARN